MIGSFSFELSYFVILIWLCAAMHKNSVIISLLYIKNFFRFDLKVLLQDRKCWSRGVMDLLEAEAQVIVE